MEISQGPTPLDKELYAIKDCLEMENQSSPGNSSTGFYSRPLLQLLLCVFGEPHGTVARAHIGRVIMLSSICIKL